MRVRRCCRRWRGRGWIRRDDREVEKPRLSEVAWGRRLYISIRHLKLCMRVTHALSLIKPMSRSLMLIDERGRDKVKYLEASLSAQKGLASR